MSPLFLLFGLVLIVAQFAVPRCYAFAPLLIAVCHFQDVAVLQLGFSLSIFKLVILAGLIRAMREGQIAFSWRQPLDRLVAIWMGWAIFSCFFHSAKAYNPMTIRLSMVCDTFGAYVYARCYVRDHEDFFRYIKALALVVIPLAMVMLFERSTLHNWYASMAGTYD